LPWTAWKTGQPVADPAKRESQDCVKIDKTGTWDEGDCTKAFAFACQKSPGTSTLSTVTDGSTEENTASTETAGCLIKYYIRKI
jgi:hypothetical protein